MISKYRPEILSPAIYAEKVEYSYEGTQLEIISLVDEYNRNLLISYSEGTIEDPFRIINSGSLTGEEIANIFFAYINTDMDAPMEAYIIINKVLFLFDSGAEVPVEIVNTRKPKIKKYAPELLKMTLNGIDAKLFADF
jgi:hypothetical protein